MRKLIGAKTGLYDLSGLGERVLITEGEEIRDCLAKYSAQLINDGWAMSCENDIKQEEKNEEPVKIEYEEELENLLKSKNGEAEKKQALRDWVTMNLNEDIAKKIDFSKKSKLIVKEILNNE